MDRSGGTSKPAGLTGADGSRQAKRVRLHLGRVSRASIGDLKQELGVEAVALYPILEMLIEEGSVEWNGDTYAVSDTRTP